MTPPAAELQPTATRRSRPRERCLVAPASGITLGELLGRQGVDAEGAVAEGRVFVERIRARRVDEWLAGGAVVSLAEPRPFIAGVTVLAERGGLVAVAKPAGIPTEPDRRGRAHSLVHLAAAALGLAPEALHALGRLDLPVSGVVLLAHGASARRDAVRWRVEGRVRRRYLALASGVPDPPRGAWDTPVGAAQPRGRGARPALTRYIVAAVAGRGASAGARPAGLIALAPVTGRLHQLRLHAAAAGAPLLGDAEHGGPTRLTRADGTVEVLGRVALHAASLEIDWPGSAPWTVAAEVPAPLDAWWEALGGAAADWKQALEATP